MARQLPRYPKSRFWQSDSAYIPERWEMDADEELQRIRKMSRVEFVEYIKDFTASEMSVFNLGKQFEDLTNMNFDDGRRAHDVFLVTMKTIFGLLQSRLDEMDNDLKVLNNDIKNIKTVMAENITSSDYTVLYLVHQNMVQKAKRLEIITKENRPENRRLCRMVLGFVHRVEVWIRQKLPE